MTTEVLKRLQEDLKQMHTKPPPGVNADISGDNLKEWDAIVFGPGGTCFEGGVFRLKLKFPDDYPNSPPAVWFYSKMFHPNVYPDGEICLDLLQNSTKWSRNYSACTVLVAIQALLGNPNPNSPANDEASELFNESRTEYERRVLEIVFFSQKDGDGATGRNFNCSDEFAKRVTEFKLV